MSDQEITIKDYVDRHYRENQKNLIEIVDRLEWVESDIKSLKEGASKKSFKQEVIGVVLVLVGFILYKLFMHISGLPG